MEELRENILNWYPFQTSSDVLEIGDSGISKMLMKHCNKVISITQNLRETVISEKFDYIVMIGIIGKIEEIYGEKIELKELMLFLEKFLKENGKFLIAVDNKFGLKYFAGNPDNILNEKFQSLIGYSNEKEKIETFTKKTLEKKLKSIGYCANFYYPLPDYRLPNVIFSDNYLPKYNTIDKYIPYYEPNSTTIFDELDVFREILKSNEEMFPFFANSFFVEASKVEAPIKYKYISFNNARKAKYRLITKITDEYVEKQMVNEASAEHYHQILKNNAILEEEGVNLLDSEVQGVIHSRYQNSKYMLSNVITELLEKKDFVQIEEILKQYIEVISKNTYQEENIDNTVFHQYQIAVEDENLISQMHFKKNGFWDMTFKNCFYIDHQFYFFDQEWNEPNMPVEYILYRAIKYTISLRRFIKIEDWFEKYHLNQFLTIFEALDDKLQENVRDEEVWKFFHQSKYINLDETLQEMKNMEIRSKAQQAAFDNLKAEYDTIQNSKSYKIYKALKRFHKKK